MSVLDVVVQDPSRGTARARSSVELTSPPKITIVRRE